jgi:ABC-type nitrate/sulfonate/bicarbonate transport system substrate-binding protein
VQRFVNAFFETVEYMRNNKAKTVEVASKVLNQPANVMNRVYDEEMPGYTKDGSFNNPKALEILSASYIDMGLLDKKPSNEELFTTRFLPAKF